MKDDINEAFLEAIKYYLNKSARGTRTQLANALGTVPAHVTDLVKGRRPIKEFDRRRVAKFFQFGYESFLEVGRDILAGREPREDDPEVFGGVTEDGLLERGFIVVPFSDSMKLAAGSGGTIIDVTEDDRESTVIVHGPSIRRTSPRGLQAFRVGGDSMEPVIAKGGIVVADLYDNDLGRLKPGKVYVLCWDLSEGECAVKYLRWAEPGRLLAITSPNQELYPPIYREARDVRLVGRVIWACRDL